jgi:hypothetical protein
MRMARITITIPAALVAASDRTARELDRSRSWLIVRALESYLAGSAARAAPVVAEPPGGHSLGVGPARRVQLEADLALDCDERVRRAEQTALVGALRRGRPCVDRVIAFDRLEDFYAWERRESIDR